MQFIPVMKKELNKPVDFLWKPYIFLRNLWC